MGTSKVKYDIDWDNITVRYRRQLKYTYKYIYYEKKTFIQVGKVDMFTWLLKW